MKKEIYTLSLLFWAAVSFTGPMTYAASTKTVICGDLRFNPPAKMGDLPDLEFWYAVKVTEFSFRDGNLMLVAMDAEDTTRLRILISAQLNKNKTAYIGQVFKDAGGHELQLLNGPVSCVVKNAE